MAVIENGIFVDRQADRVRLGHKVAVTRTEFVNEESVLIAVGTSTYIVG